MGIVEQCDQIAASSAGQHFVQQKQQMIWVFLCVLSAGGRHQNQRPFRRNPQHLLQLDCQHDVEPQKCHCCVFCRWPVQTPFQFLFHSTRRHCRAVLQAWCRSCPYTPHRSSLCCNNSAYTALTEHQAGFQVDKQLHPPNTRCAGPPCTASCNKLQNSGRSAPSACRHVQRCWWGQPWTQHVWRGVWLVS